LVDLRSKPSVEKTSKRFLAQHNGTQYDDIQHNDTQYYDIL
jgi:hypothetical protein